MISFRWRTWTLPLLVLLTFFSFGSAQAATFQVTLATMQANPFPNVAVGQPASITLSASLDGSNNAGQECQIQNVKWKWTITSIQDYTGSMWVTASPAPTVNYSDAEKSSNPSHLSIIFNAAGYYKINYSVTATFDSPNCGGNGLTASASDAGGISAGSVSDFNLTVTPQSINVNIDSSTSATVTGSALNGFTGIVNETVTSGNDITGTLKNGYIYIPTSSTDALTVTSTSANAGTYPLTIRGESAGSGSTPGLSHEVVANVTVLPRTVQIAGPWGPPGAANYSKGPGNTQIPNQRAADGSISVDTLLLPGTDPATSLPLWYDTPNLAAKITGFKPNPIYQWKNSGDLTPNTGSTHYFVGNYANISPTMQSSSYGPHSNVFTVGVTNANGHISTSNTYSVKWHEKLENPSVLSVTQDANAPLIDLECTPGSQKAGGGVMVTPPGAVDNDISWLSTAPSWTHLAGVVAEDRYVEAFAAALEIAEKSTPETSTTQFPKSDDPALWQDAVTSTLADYHASPQNTKDYRVDSQHVYLLLGTNPPPMSELLHSYFNFTVKYKENANIYKYLGDHYESGGYQGQGITYTRIVQSGMYVTYYTYATPPL